ncbi:DUF29 domain-containing protein [Vacuolonema iberomarrocanum]|uniref:DUF29 domain-containing protein n=1 Tax=Vacuolonema iberomarrocanum TaxID=3454632 RepID=UPI001A080760|nr:DUF29 domain-containing protein [filamentous cyanobacterium LEGE 07170]
MQPDLNLQSTSLYEQDYHRWLETTVAQLKFRNVENLDYDNLIEELESLGKSEKRALSSYMMRLCEHLLKVQYWEQERAQCLRGWIVEIRNFRLQIQAILEDSPSLKNHLESRFIRDYQNARNLFLDASSLESSSIPQTPPFSVEQVLNQTWLPE